MSALCNVSLTALIGYFPFPVNGPSSERHVFSNVMDSGLATSLTSSRRAHRCISGVPWTFAPWGSLSGLQPRGLCPVWGTSLWSRGTAWREMNNRDKVLWEDHNTHSSSCCTACWVRKEVGPGKKREWWKCMFSFVFIFCYSTVLLLICLELNLFLQVALCAIYFPPVH